MPKSRSRLCHVIGLPSWVLPALTAALFLVADAKAAPIVVDSFPDSTVIGAPGISQSSVGSQSYGPEAGLSGVVGGSRGGSLSLTTGSTNNPGVNLQITGGSGQLQFKSGNQAGNDGEFTLFYNGGAAPTPFPLDLTNGTSFEFDIQSHTNSDQNTVPVTLFEITLLDSNNISFTFSDSTGQQNGLFNVLFGNPVPVGFNLGQVATVTIRVDPNEGTNIALKGIQIQGDFNGGNGGGSGSPIPEPASMALWSGIGLGALVGARYRKRFAAAPKA